MPKLTAEEIKKQLDSGVRSLVLNNNRYSAEYNGKYMDLEGVKEIGEVLKENTSLKELSLIVEA